MRDEKLTAQGMAGFEFAALDEAIDAEIISFDKGLMDLRGFRRADGGESFHPLAGSNRWADKFG